MNFEKWLQSNEEEAIQCRWYIMSCSLYEKTNCYAEDVAKYAFEAGRKEGINEAKKLITEYLLGD